MARRILPVAALAFAVLAGTSRARADDVAVIAPPRREGFDSALSQRVAPVIEERLRVRFDVVSVRETERRIERAGIRCNLDNPDCARVIAHTLGVTYTCEFVVWRANERRPAELVVTMSTPSGERGGGTADLVGDGDSMAAAVDTAIERAIADLAAPNGVPVFVTGPVGAAIVVDHQPMGMLPWNGVLATGEHEISISYREQTATRTIEVAPPEMHVQIDLPHAADAGTHDRTAEEGCPTTERVTYRPAEHVVGPIALGVAGLGLLTADAIALATLPDCEERDGNRCLRGGFIDEVPFAIYGVLGIASLVGAAVWFAVGEQTEERPVTVRAGLGLGSIRLEGSW